MTVSKRRRYNGSRASESSHQIKCVVNTAVNIWPDIDFWVRNVGVVNSEPRAWWRVLGQH